jgi:hypothetical protein
MPLRPGNFLAARTGDRHDLVAREELAQVFALAPVARERRHVPNYQAGGVGCGRFQILGRGAGVADVWIGERDDLSGIGRIGEDFLITGQRGIENDFASSVAFGADRLAAEDRSIFQSQDRGYRHAGTPLEPSPGPQMIR